jgi:cell division protein ZapA (FtsZ GTPase activity inhibitor)
MANVEVLIGKILYKIPCRAEEKEHVKHLAKKFNQRLNDVSTEIKTTDEALLLVAAALSMEDELEIKEAITQQEELGEQQVYEALSDNMENIADYIEKLTKKIQNY